MNHSNETISVELLDRYLAGASTAQEQSLVQAWIDENPRRKVEFALVKAPSMQAQAALRRVLDERGGEQGRGSETGRARQPWQYLLLGKRNAMSLGVWASLALIVVLTGTLTFLGTWRPGKLLSDSIIQTYTTVTGQEGSLTLDDGTRVTLAPGTTLRMSTFGNGSRTVDLDGEAYFNVKHADGAPFIVRTGEISTRVLGTAFVVKRYSSDSYVRVAVESGKVSVSASTAQRPSVVLTAGFSGVVTDSTANVAPVDDMAIYTGWMNGDLTFHETEVGEIVNALNRWYGYQFQFKDPAMINRSITVVLSTQSIEAALSTLRVVLETDVTVTGETVIIGSNDQKLNRDLTTIPLSI